MLVNSVYGKFSWISRMQRYWQHFGIIFGSPWFVASICILLTGTDGEDFGSSVRFSVLPGEYRMYLDKAMATSKFFPIRTCVLPCDPIWTEALLYRKKWLILVESVLSASDILDIEQQLQKIP